jgi:outer membrane protein W
VIASENGDVKDYDLQMEFIIGSGFRHNITGNLNLQFGMGFDWMLVYAKYNQKNTAGDTIDFSKAAYNFGIGGDIGFKYDITDFFDIHGGVTLSYMFFNNTQLYSSQKTSNDVETRTRIYDDNIKGYSKFSIKPYICIGLNYYQEKVVLGKPKE